VLVKNNICEIPDGCHAAADNLNRARFPEFHRFFLKYLHKIWKNTNASHSVVGNHGVLNLMKKDLKKCFLNV
jgi:hypothetical protein